jgi:hypothetical protein
MSRFYQKRGNGLKNENYYIKSVKKQWGKNNFWMIFVQKGSVSGAINRQKMAVS